MLKKLLAVLLCLCTLAPLSAQAEVELLPQLTQWRLEESPGAHPGHGEHGAGRVAAL